LPNESSEALSRVFDNFKHAELKRLPVQYSSCQEERLNLDMKVLKALEPSLNDEARDRITELYLDLSEAFKKWIGQFLEVILKIVVAYLHCKVEFRLSATNRIQHMKKV